MIEVCSSFIDGAFTHGSSGARLPVVSPIDGTEIAFIAEAAKEEVDDAVTAARNAFEAGEWRNSSVVAKQKVLRRIAALIRENADILAQRECSNTGIPLKQIVERHVPRAAENFEFFADFIGQVQNESSEQIAPYLSVVRREPVGVAAVIAPWNAPLALATMGLASALAFGNSVILKPSEFTPLEFVQIFEILAQAGIPKGVVGLVNGRGPVTGSALVNNPDIDAIVFIGGTEAGRKIGEAAGRNLTKYVAELGGKSANIITPQCALDRAIDATLLGSFSNNGQQCLAGSRILVAEQVLDEFLSKFIQRVQKLKIGDPRDPSTEIGPVINLAQYDRVLSFSNGSDAQILTGGHRATGFDQGLYIEPTVALASSNSSPLCQEEIFGPFATVLSYRDIEEAIEIANDSQYGLVAYLWCDHLPTVMKVQDGLRVGTVWVNTPVTRDLRLPFGGFKNSGIGRTGGVYCRDLFTEEKVLTMPMRDFPVAQIGLS